MIRRIQQIDQIVKLLTRPLKYRLVPLTTWNCVMEYPTLHSTNRTNPGFNRADSISWYTTHVIVFVNIQVVCTYVYMYVVFNDPQSIPKKYWPLISSSPITDGAPYDSSPLSLVVVSKVHKRTYTLVARYSNPQTPLLALKQFILPTPLPFPLKTFSMFI